MIAFEVKDMTCAHCIGTITKALGATDPDAKVRIDLASHRVLVEPASAGAQELSDTIKAAGYTPVPVAADALAAAPSGAKSCCGRC